MLSDHTVGQPSVGRHSPNRGSSMGDAIGVGIAVVTKARLMGNKIAVMSILLVVLGVGLLGDAIHIFV